MATLRPLPSPLVPMVDKNGFPSQVWYEYFTNREKAGIADLPDVADTAPTNGQVLIFNSTSGKYEPGSN